MATKRKLIISFASLGILVILAGAALGIALAAISGNFTSGFSISYTANNVSAAIFGSYRNDGYFKSMKSGSDDYILFNGNETGNNATKEFDTLEDFNLTAENPSVTLRYRFLNFKQDLLPLNVKLSGNIENLKIDYKATLFDGTDYTRLSGSSTQTPVTEYGYVPYSGFDSFEEMTTTANQLMEGFQSSIDENTAALYNMLQEYGYQAVYDYLDNLFFSNFETLDIHNYDQYLDIFGVQLSLLIVHAYEYYLQTESAESTLNLLETTVNNLTVREDVLNYYLTENNAQYRELFIFGAKYTASALYAMDITYVHSLIALIEAHEVSRGNYVLPFVKELDYENWLSGGWEHTDGGAGSFETRLLIYNVYNTFLNESYEAAIDLLNSIKEGVSPFLEHDYYGSAEILAPLFTLEEELTAYRDAGESGRQQALAQQENYASLIRNSYGYNSYKDVAQQTDIMVLILGNAPIDDLIVASMMVPYTEISVTISIDDYSEEAYLTDGRMEFTLGY